MIPFTELVLASTSPARRALLDTLRLPYVVEAPGVDEAVLPGTPVRQAVALLAERKARAVAKRRPTSLVLGSDQLVSLDGVALGKPASEHAARQQLKALAGRSHDILTGVCLVGPGFFVCEVDVARLRVFPLSPEELDGYVATGEWEGCAGGYRVEGRGQALFEAIEGDRTSVQGLPMARVVRLLREAGVQFF
jgi:septum formation protein